MNFDRNERARSILQSVIADFIRGEANTDPLITVTRLDPSPDMKRVIVMITAYPSEKEEAAIIFLKRKGSELREYVKQHARLRGIPNFEFMVDYGERNRQNVDKVVKKLDELK